MRFNHPTIQGIFDGLCTLWASDVRYVETKLPSAVAAQRIGRMGRALAGEQVASEQWRVRQAFAPS